MVVEECVGVVACCSDDFTCVVMYFQLLFPVFCMDLGRNPPWALARVGSGGVGCVIHVCSIH